MLVWGGKFLLVCAKLQNFKISALRNSLKLEIPPFKSNIKKYSISYRGPVLWNHLPIECRNANSAKSFSRMINKLTLIRDIDFLIYTVEDSSSLKEVFRSIILLVR